MIYLNFGVLRRSLAFIVCNAQTVKSALSGHDTEYISITLLNNFDGKVLRYKSQNEGGLTLKKIEISLL
jgi:hypothetical protein